MNQVSHNHTSENPNGNQTETEQPLIAIEPAFEGYGRIVLPKSNPWLVKCCEEPTEREILAAMVSELCAECFRVGATFMYMPEERGYCEEHLAVYWDVGQETFGVDVGFRDDDAAEQVADLIKRVAALGGEA